MAVFVTNWLSPRSDCKDLIRGLRPLSVYFPSDFSGKKNVEIHHEPGVGPHKPK